jgi:hypothetical protein
MRTELISISSPTHPLDGAYYPTKNPSKGAAMVRHGNLYVGAACFLRRTHITRLGYEYLAFNRRGRDSVCPFDSRVGNELMAEYSAGKGYCGSDSYRP